MQEHVGLSADFIEIILASLEWRIQVLPSNDGSFLGRKTSHRSTARKAENSSELRHQNAAGSSAAQGFWRSPEQHLPDRDRATVSPFRSSLGLRFQQRTAGTRGQTDSTRRGEMDGIP